MAFNEAHSTPHEDYWREQDTDFNLRGRIQEFWNTLPAANRAWLEVLAVISFEDVLDIDELGDEFFEAPHIYAPFTNRELGPFKVAYGKLESIEPNSRILYVRPDVGRIAIFPLDMREEQAGS